MSDDEMTGNDTGENSEPPRRLSRRGLFKAGAVTSLTAAGAYTATLPGLHSETEAAPAPVAVIPVADVHQMAAMPTQVNTLAGYTFFNPLMVDVISAAADRIIPADSLSPSATESGVVYFIDRQISSEYGMVGKRYGAGPFMAGAPTQGDQIGLTMRERYGLGVNGIQTYAQQKYQKAFKDLAPDQQDQILRDMEAGTATGFTGITPAAFFQLFVSHVKAGFFADPVYGGNRNMAGWKMIGYPGAQIVYQNWIGRYGAKFTGEYMSLADHQEALHPKAAPAMPAAMTSPAASPGATGVPASATARPMTTATSAPSVTSGAQAMGAGMTVNVMMKDFAFALDRSTVSPGSVTFNITNQGPSPHNIEFTSLRKVSDTIETGQTTKLTVDFQPGMYDYICNIPGHAQLGMKGSLTVK